MRETEEKTGVTAKDPYLPQELSLALNLCEC
jgi:hypothetical protein